MKKILLFIVILCFSGIAKAQQIIYTPFYPNQSQSNSQNQPQAQSQKIRATSYFTDSYSGNTYKVPIAIQQQKDAWGNIDYYVVEYYIDSGIGGRWQTVSPAKISRCNSALAGGLERQFMYKSFFNTRTHYFDF